MREKPFKFDMQVDFFEKSDADPKERRRIGGIASIETEDQDGEILLQRGLDFGPFLKGGWFNDNHGKKTSDILGYPDKNGVKYFKKGDKLPSGATAKAPGHWVEGYLIEGYEPADKIWKLGKSLRSTDRKLGFSVEGKVIQRTGPQDKIVSKAMVRNVAVTHCPVNSDAQMDVLVKSLAEVEQSEDDLSKMLTVGTPPADHAAPEGPKTGEDAGQVLGEESLEDDEDDPKKNEKSLSDSEAIAHVRARMPGASKEHIDRFLRITRSLKAQKNL